MCEWANLLLFVNPTLITNMEKQPVIRQATIQKNPPLVHATSQPQDRPISFRIPPMNTFIPNYPYPPQHYAYAAKPPHLTPRMHNPTIQAHRYGMSLHQISWHCAPLISFQILPYPNLLYQNLLYHINNPPILSTMSKHSLNHIFTKAYTMLRRSLSTFMLS